MASLPLISCITPTTASRNEFLPLLLRSFFWQDYPNKELIVISEDDIPLPNHPNIRLVKCKAKLSTGEKRNIGASNARGPIIAHFDSDDYSAPHRLTEMYELMRSSKKPVVGYNYMPFFNVNTHVIRYWKPWSNAWSCGTALVYLKSYWKTFPFENKRIGEDFTFCERAKDNNAIISISGANVMVALDHATNTDKGRAGADFVVKSPDAIKRIKEMVFPTKLQKVALSVLTWNTKNISMDSVKALIAEKGRLESAGFQAEVIVCDNGSNDGTVEALQKLKDITLILNKQNVGISVAKNQVTEKALANGADYVFFSDGDIEIVPWSLLQMTLWLMQHPKAGCIGPFYEDCVNDRNKTAPHWTGNIAGLPVGLWAPCLYGLFPKRVLLKCKFDKNLGPGWGAEDNDLAAQMHQAGFIPHSFRGMIFLHRHAHSAITNLRAEGMNVEKKYLQRKRYLAQKWAHLPEMLRLLESSSSIPAPEPPPSVTLDADAQCKMMFNLKYWNGIKVKSANLVFQSKNFVGLLTSVKSWIQETVGTGYLVKLSCKKFESGGCPEADEYKEQETLQMIVALVYLESFKRKPKVTQSFQLVDAFGR